MTVSLGSASWRSNFEYFLEEGMTQTNRLIKQLQNLKIQTEEFLENS